MMCDCLEKLHQDLKPKIHEKFSKPNKPVESYSISQTMGGRAVVNVSINLENQMKSASSYLVAEYCPWCGQKYVG